MYDLYRYCRITGVHVKLTLSPDGTSVGPSAEIAMAKVPFSEAASVVPAQLQTLRGSKYKLVSTALGALPRSIEGSFGSFDELGNPCYDRTFWQTEAEATSVALDNDEPVIAVAARTVLGASSIVGINLEVTYHMEFFDLHIPDDLTGLGAARTLDPRIGVPHRSATLASTREEQMEESFTKIEPTSRAVRRR